MAWWEGAFLREKSEVGQCFQKVKSAFQCFVISYFCYLWLFNQLSPKLGLQTLYYHHIVILGTKNLDGAPCRRLILPSRGGLGGAARVSEGWNTEHRLDHSLLPRLLLPSPVWSLLLSSHWTKKDFYICWCLKKIWRRKMPHEVWNLHAIHICTHK